MKVVILCGGLGARMKEETEFRPKPLVAIGQRPIIWHIMKLFSFYGFKDFILCLGYRGDLLKEYFLKFRTMHADFTINLKDKSTIRFHNEDHDTDWNVTLAHTGLRTPTGGRIHKIAHYITENHFFVTYGDGLADINIRRLLEHHLAKGKTGTMTGVHPVSRYGVIDYHNDGIRLFREKPLHEGWINGGFFVFQRRFFDYLDTDAVLEKEPMDALIGKKQLALYRHHGFWRSMDTFKDAKQLNALYAAGRTPWMVWRDPGAS